MTPMHSFRCALFVAVALTVGCGPGDDDSGKLKDTPKWTDELADLEQHGQITCADPSLRDAAPFVRQTSDNPPNTDIWLWSGGEMVGDLDGDGAWDVIEPNELAAANLRKGTAAGTFIPRAEQLAQFDLSLGVGGSLVDYDADGDLDVYVLRYDATNVLLRNDGDLEFTDVTAETGVTGCEPDGSLCYKSMSSSWADYDRDGDLDLIVGNYGYVLHDGTNPAEFDPGEPSFFYENNGDGTFDDVTEEVLPHATMQHVHDGYTYVAGFHDFDMDGWPELYFVNDFGQYSNSVVLWNEQGTLVLDDHLHGLDVPLSGMGLAVGDVNSDGLPDVLIPEWNHVSTFLSSGPVWAEDLGSGIAPNNSVGQKVGWGAEWADVDNDGDLDAIVAYGKVRSQNVRWDNPLSQPDGLYIHQPNGTFVEESNLWANDDKGVGRGFVAADFNNDGWIDISKRDLLGPNIMQLSNCGAENWMRIELHAPETLNTFAIGAVIKIGAGDLLAMRILTAGGTNYASSGPPEAHFGLGSHEVVDTITVTWPDGEMSTFHDVPSRQILSITRK